MDKIIEWAFQGVMTSCLIYGVSAISERARELKASIDELNASVARIIEKMSWHEKELERLDDRVKDLENK